MKKPAISISTLTAFLFAVVTANGQPQALSAKKEITEKKQIRIIDNRCYQSLVGEQNPDYNLLLLSSKTDLSLQAALVDKNEKLVFRIACSSEQLLLSPYSERIVCLIKNQDEGHATEDADLEFHGLKMYDVKGNLVKDLSNTGLIGECVFTPGGIIIHNENNLTCFSNNGEQVWKIAVDKGTLQNINSPDYVSFDSYNYDTDVHTLDLISCIKGNVVNSWKNKSSEDFRILFADKKPDKIFATSAGNKIEQYNSESNRKILSLQVSGTPFFGRWNQKRNTFQFIILKDNMAVSRAEFIEWNTTSNTTGVIDLGHVKIDDMSDFAEINPVTGSYKLTTVKQLISITF